ncbi:MAG: hypothetical protein MI865_01210 [Proteobacteria bacterium]|nr:hypothetical protein [Pseudomonadota bacterium]
MRKIYFGDFRLYVLGHIKEIQQNEIEAYTTEWFLLRYLKKITKVTEGKTEYTRVEGPVRSLIRFYVDNIDERSELADRCKKIHHEYRKTLYEKQSSKYS